MGFWINSKIQIGKYKFAGVHEVKISKSIHSFVDTCTLQVPTDYRLKQVGIPQTEGAALKANMLFKEGDKVIIQLGWNGRYNDEFVGYVRRVNFNTPVEIECEGYVYLLRQPLPYKSFVNTNLKTLLQYIIQGTDIVLSPATPDVPVEKFDINNVTGAEVLEQLKKKLLVTIFFSGNELFAGLEYTAYKGNVILKLGWNVVRDNQLKQRIADDGAIEIMLTGVKNDGTKITVTAGKSTNILKVKTHIVTDQKTLQAMADKMLKDKQYSGYEGKITCLGFPYYQHAWTVDLRDDRYPERAGHYVLDSVEVRYGTGGYWRIGGISIKVA